MALFPGSVIRLKGRFCDAATNQDTDAPGVTLKVSKPDGTEHEGAVIVHDGPGHYHADVAVDLSGKWRYRWSAGEAADEGAFVVEASAFV